MNEITRLATTGIVALAAVGYVIYDYGTGAAIGALLAAIAVTYAFAPAVRDGVE